MSNTETNQCMVEEVSDGILKLQVSESNTIHKINYEVPQTDQSQRTAPTQPKAAIRPPAVTRSTKYVAEAKKFGRTGRGDITYEGSIICRYFCTSRGCRSGIGKCRFLHKQLGCVFHQQAKQGCCFGEDGAECPFSHDSDTPVIVSVTLSDCTTEGCGRSCMHAGSTCLLCFNKSSRDRRDRALLDQRGRRDEFTNSSQLQVGRVQSVTGEITRPKFYAPTTRSGDAKARFSVPITSSGDAKARFSVPITRTRFVNK